MKLRECAFFLFIFSYSFQTIACKIPEKWSALCLILDSRVQQKSSKMKLTQDAVSRFEQWLQKETYSWVNLIELQKSAPKITVELLMSVSLRGVEHKEADLMAELLRRLIQTYRFENLAAFDENTSHIIGREWHDIDYSGERMTWQLQAKKYKPYGIKNFKTQDQLEAFFKVESKLPYFKKIYRPKI